MIRWRVGEGSRDKERDKVEGQEAEGRRILNYLGNQPMTLSTLETERTNQPMNLRIYEISLFSFYKPNNRNYYFSQEKIYTVRIGKIGNHIRMYVCMYVCTYVLVIVE